MIRLAEVADAFLPDLEAQYGDRLLPGHRNALSAILRCRTEACGMAAIHCPDCESEDSFPRGGVVTLAAIPYPRNRKPPDGPRATDREIPM